MIKRFKNAWNEFKKAPTLSWIWFVVLVIGISLFGGMLKIANNSKDQWVQISAEQCTISVNAEKAFVSGKLDTSIVTCGKSRYTTTSFSFDNVDEFLIVVRGKIITRTTLEDKITLPVVMKTYAKSKKDNDIERVIFHK